MMFRIVLVCLALLAMPARWTGSQLCDGCATMFPSLAAILPFAVEELESGKAHLVMTSDDIWGGKASTAVLFGTEKFHSENPRLYAATAGSGVRWD